MVSYSRKDLFSSQWQDTFFDPVSYVCQFKNFASQESGSLP